MANEIRQGSPTIHDQPSVPNSIHHNDDGPPPLKRRKILLACSACRDRKSRCDGRRPICSACTKRKAASTCVYEESTLKTQRDIAILESRVRELEGSNTSNALGQQQSPGPIDEDSAHIFGKSSAASFVQSLKQTILHSHGADPTRAPQYNTTPNKLNPRANPIPVRSGYGLDTSAFSLPTRKQADRYMYCFWEYVHPIFPILHKPSFVSSYRSIWISEEERSGDDHASIEDPIFLSTLSIVFALGCQYTEEIEPSRKSVITERFYHQSRKFLAMDELDSVSVLAVQLLLLSGIYLLNSSYSNRCWNMVGLAIRNAQSLGLHEENRRLVATIFGRPHMISLPSSIPLPLLIDDEYLLVDGEGQQPANTDSYLGFFLSSLKLFDIMSDVLTMYYNQKESSLHSHHTGTPWWRSHLLDDILKIDSTLDDFANTLPNHLKIQQNTAEAWTQNAGNMKWRQAKILQCRFLYVRAFLLRPLLLSAVQASKDASLNPKSSAEELGERVALQVCVKCIENVHELVTAIYSSLHVNYQSPEWVTHCKQLIVTSHTEAYEKE
ncbi:hypothetical protein EG329_001798 [Mollisiaceae sp. DMI_Dod_QoI]|nr:hypothetical protein EG329_001798 [Helotiales sp. DMI_Dod_QoI]